MIAQQKQKVIEKEAETERKKAVIGKLRVAHNKTFISLKFYKDIYLLLVVVCINSNSPHLPPVFWN